MSDGGEERRLAQLAARGDREAFRHLLNALMPRLLAAARACGVPESDVEDVAQEVALLIWRKLPTYNPEHAVGSWAVVITANKARDWLRRRRVRNFWLGAAKLDDGIVADQTPTDDVAAQRIEVERLRIAIAKLPRAYGLPLILTSVLGFTQSETATALGISTKAVEMRIARARKRLGDLLKTPPD